MPREGRSIPNSIHSTAQRIFPLAASIPSGALARESGNFYLRGQQPSHQADAGLSGAILRALGTPGISPFRPRRLSHPLLSLSLSWLPRDVGHIPVLARARALGEQKGGERHLRPFPSHPPRRLRPQDGVDVTDSIYSRLQCPW